MIKHGGKIFKMYLSRLIIIPILIINFSSSKAALIDVEAPGIYGGFWRDLYKLGPVVIDTIGADLGVFGGPSFKMGLSFATVVGLLSTNENHDIFGSISESSKKYNSILNALEPSDFSYSTAALKLEYIMVEGNSFGWSTTTNFGVGVLGFKPEEGQLVGDSLYHLYLSLGTALIIKITNNLRTSIGISYRKDLNANEAGRPSKYENFDAVTIYNHFYLVKF